MGVDKETDIILGNSFEDDYSIHLTGDFVYIDGSDLHLTSSERRSSPGYRRALVHDVNDQLTVNYASDYPGGVEINGITKVLGSDVHLDCKERRNNNKPTSQFRRALVHDFSDKLTLNYGADYPGGVKIIGTVEGDVFSVNTVHLSGSIYAGNIEIRASKAISVGEGEGGGDIPGGIFVDGQEMLSYIQTQDFLIQQLSSRLQQLENQLAILQKTSSSS